MKPILKYRGGKKAEIPFFIDHIPNDIETYFEPFVGGGAVFFHLEHEKSVINDINSKLYKFYLQLKHNFDEVTKQLNELQEIYEKNQKEYEEKKALAPAGVRVENKNEELYYELRNEFNYPSGKWLDAVIYYFINKTAYSGMIRYNSKGEYNVPFGRYKNFNTKIITKQHHNLLQKTEIYNKDFSEIFKMAKPNDFMFLDPPYDCIFSDYGNMEFTGDFDEREHRRLAEEFKNLKCRALMIISKTELTTELYKDYIVDEYHKSYSVNIRNRFKNEAKHYIIKNYDYVRKNKEEKYEQLELIH
ncbi:DNA methyltransferase [Bacillaceae bacterium ZC4]|jgi:DNA adenine methylase|uniref:site-specific DNA-methyltransferase (adenine-specific) n=2 Tax=Bacillales TaxID=1385 RepID=Q9AM78_GEOSE|nr:N.BstNBI methyltransferase [Geobacillus stearothermophilus]AAX89133.1 M1.BstSEI [Geobacillus stearothermophilus]ABN42184.1 adenine methyltransferase M.BspD6I [Bacillus sp. D6]AXI38573.1 DNA methyltransferase [Bacillaceae bacterium ZC4]MDR9794324.1 Dam family site-specific DNA-(adenine-N6)-methyltransferase [Aeribacillus pallidus]